MADKIFDVGGQHAEAGCSRPELLPGGHPAADTSGHPAADTSGHPAADTSGHPAIVSV